MLRNMTEDEPVPQREPEKPEPETPHHPEEDASSETEEDQLNMNGSESEQRSAAAPNLTETERLEILERGLRYTVDVLGNTKMAQRFKALKELFATLTALVNVDDMPDVQRVKTIEAELRNGVDVLAECSCAARSKVTIDLREYLIDLLDKVQA